MARILNIVIWSLLVAGLVVCLGFVSVEEKQLPCRSVSINIDRSKDYYFVEEKDITSAIYDRGDSLVGKPVQDINIALLEKIIRNNPFISNAEVYSGIDGDIRIDIKQRNPVVRIVGEKDSYYIDETGIFMPLSDKYAARVLVASGNIFEPYSFRDARLLPGKGEEVDTLLQGNTLLYRYTLKDSLYTLAKFIEDNEFWKAQFQQVFVTAAHEFELVPLVGNHRIMLGDLSDMEEKFEKLMLFYRRGLAKTGWDRYHTIDLKYKNQVVCTKKQ